MASIIQMNGWLEIEGTKYAVKGQLIEKMEVSILGPSSHSLTGSFSFQERGPLNAPDEAILHIDDGRYAFVLIDNWKWSNVHPYPTGNFTANEDLKTDG